MPDGHKTAHHSTQRDAPASESRDDTQAPEPRGSSAWPSTHASLLLLLRDGSNASAWEDFVDIYMPLVYAFCTKRGLQNADASDVTQIVFQKLSGALPGFEYSADAGFFRGWLGTLTRNEISRYRGRNRRQVGSVGLGIVDTLAEAQVKSAGRLWTEEFNDHILRTALDRIRREFSTEVWSAFEMLWLHGKSTTEVAAAFQRDHNWLYKAKHHVIQRLEQEILFLTDDVPQFHI